MIAILGGKGDQNNICDDYLELDWQRKDEIVSPFQFEIPGKSSCW